MSRPARYLLGLAVTALFLVASHHTVVLLHEYTHGTLAWAFGHKDSPLDIHYGPATPANILTLADIDEDVNYALLDMLGQRTQLGIIAITPPLILNAGLFLLGWWLLERPRIRENRPLAYFLLLCTLMNLGNVLDYVPVRTFMLHGDVGHFLYAFRLSPYWIYLPGTLVVLYWCHRFLGHILPLASARMELDGVERAALLGLCVFLLAFWFAGCGLGSTKPLVGNVLAWSLIAAAPLALWFYRPSRTAPRD